jgi:hypothetical protein
MLSCFDALLLFAFLFLGPASLSLPARIAERAIGTNPLYGKCCQLSLYIAEPICAFVALLLVARVSTLCFSFGCDCEVRQLVAVRSLEACLVALVTLWILELIELAFLFLSPCVKV